MYVTNTMTLPDLSMPNLSIDLATPVGYKTGINASKIIGNKTKISENKDTIYHYDNIPDIFQKSKIKQDRFTQERTKKELEEAYAREDEIRKETQEREDNAYQRATEDMRKAGIEPNLHGVTPATSGGGISPASRKDMTYIQNLATMLLQEDAQKHEKVMQNRSLIQGSLNRILPSLISAL